ncbi:MAG: hypothetical protein Q7T87_12895 [Polaromonas sp.]|nr:hypothetical protein [Polaromonas sp.]
MDITQAILDELGQTPAPAGTSLPRLGKRLGLGVSVLMRQLSFMGDAVMGGQAGPGWVRVEHDGERWMAYLTEAGRLQALASPSTTDDADQDAA